MGYFPSYTLGNLYASQLWDTLIGELGDQDDAIARGEFASILGWLKEKVHSRGALYRAEELLAEICGRGSDSSCFIRYLKEKQNSLYD
jgi:carboxypeptidase Taq